MIDEKNVPEMNKILWYNFQDGCSAEDVEEALTAIYEIGLECIGADEEPGRTMGPGMPSFQRDQLRASQRKAWAKACGVAEK